MKISFAGIAFVAASLVSACLWSEELPELPSAHAGDRVLIIAPHIDDESIAAAGYASDAVRLGADVTILYLTAGDDNFVAAALESHTLWPRSRDYLQEGAARIQEGRRAMALLGISSVFFLGYPDHGLERMLQHPDRVIESRGPRLRRVPYPQALSPGAENTLLNLMRDAERVVALTRPTVIMTSADFDAHPDHRAAASIGKMLAGRIRPAPQLLMYLVHARRFPEPHRLAPALSLEPPQQFRQRQWAVYPLSAANQEAKARVLRQYASQWKDPDVRFLMESFVRKNELFVKPAP